MPEQHRKSYAAVFIDFENIYYFIKNHYLEAEETHNYAVDLIRRLRTKLSKEQANVLVMEAYGDFEAMPAGPQGPLYLLGVNTHNVLGTKHKNAADMQLAIDAMETLYTRPDIDTYVLVAGDRDYIPLLQRFRKQGKEIKVVGFKESVSGDLIQMLGEEHFLDASVVLGDEKLDELKTRRRNRIQQHIVAKPAPPTASGAAPFVTAPVAHANTGATAFATAMRIPNKVERSTLSFILDQLQFFDKPELWAGPFFKKLTDVLPELDEYERRQIVTSLVRAGAVAMEKRPGEPHDYSVIIANYDHPDVRELVPGTK